MPEKRTPVALVTGARRGLGAAAALALATRGFDVALADLELDQDAQQALAAVKQTGRRAVFLAADIGNLSSHAALADQVWSAFGTLDCLVNNAGVQVKARGDLLDITPESFDRLVSVNLRGTFFLTQAVARRMVNETRAPGEPHRSIVTLSSANAVNAALNRGEYCISKSGLTMVNKLFALRLADHGISCYEIRPGVIRTGMTAPAKADYDQRIPNGLVPMRRWGEPEDVGVTIATLASGALPFNTGQAFAVDGGLHIEKL
jgi:NAD(P)-dependent dehydrogenase (short-subunit alcohol dehydrogenase family)